METTLESPAHTTISPAQSSGRLLSIDALRGFNMFWILGADEWVAALASTHRNGFTALLATQMSHSAWEGLTFYDLIFPLFLFIVGVSVVFSLSKIIQQKGKSGAIKRVIVRSVLLFGLGVIYYGGFSNAIGDIRLLGVLQRIALCYLFASLLFISLKPRGLVAVCAVLLLGYWALMALVPVPEIGAGHYEAGRNLANYVDSIYLPLSKWNGSWDPEGLLSTLPSIGTCLLGVLAGLFLRNGTIPAQKKVFWLCATGVVSLLLGFLWGYWFPIIKQIWTSSYVLATGGFSAFLLALFYQIMEIWKWRRWAAPFIWIGSNAIALYMLFGWPGMPMKGGIFSFHNLANRLAGGPLKTYVFKQYGELVLATVVVGLVVWLAYALHKRKIFIRL